MYTPTNKEIEELKAKHGAIYKLQVEDKCCLLKTPSRKALGYASQVGMKDPMKFNEILLNDCFVAGDEEIKTDDSYFLSASGKVAELLQVKEAQLVKL